MNEKMMNGDVAGAMGLSSELMALLMEGNQAYQEALTYVNEPPPDGLYTVVLKSVGMRSVTAKSGDNAGKTFGVLRLAFAVLNEGEHNGYVFTHDVWPGASMADVARLARLCAGSVPQRLDQAFFVLKGVEGKAVFDVEIERTTSSKGRVYVNVRALRRVDVEEE